MEKNKSDRYALIAGVLLGIVVIWQFIYYLVFGGFYRVYGISLYSVLVVIAYAGSSILFLLKKRARYAPIPLALLMLLSFLRCINYFKLCISVGTISSNPHLFSTLTSILDAVAYLSLFCLALVNFAPAFQSKKQAINKLWFIPAALTAVRGIQCFLTYFRVCRGWGWFLYFYYSDELIVTLLPIILLTGALWIAYPDGLPRKKKVAQVNNGNMNMQNTGAIQTTSEIYCGLVKHILLLLFTCGIWYLVWIYRITNYLNCVEDEEPRNPTSKLLLCIFVPFYSIYWIYKSAQRIDKLAATKGVPSDLSVLCLILAIFVGIIPPILMQEKLNVIVTAGDTTIQRQTVKSSKPDLGVAEELKTYKELLDSGVITQEEFQAKKKQLLDL